MFRGQFGEKRKALSGIIFAWCIFWASILVISIMGAFIDQNSCVERGRRDCPVELDPYFSLADASPLSMWFAGFIGLSLIWFMLRSLEKDEETENEIAEDSKAIPLKGGN